MGGLSSTGGLALKSIQRGTISITGTNLTATATISAVNTSKAEVRFLGTDLSLNDALLGARLTLTNSTTVTATRLGGNGIVEVSYEVTEWQ